jgi:hypothetical protein
MAEGQWTLEIEAAWAQLFKLLTFHMKSAYSSRSHSSGAEKDSSHRSDSNTAHKNQQCSGHSSGHSNSHSHSHALEITKAFPRHWKILIIKIYKFMYLSPQESYNMSKTEYKDKCFCSHAFNRM